MHSFADYEYLKNNLCQMNSDSTNDGASPATTTSDHTGPLQSCVTRSISKKNVQTQADCTIKDTLNSIKNSEEAESNSSSDATQLIVDTESIVDLPKARPNRTSHTAQKQKARLAKARFMASQLRAAKAKGVTLKRYALKQNPKHPKWKSPRQAPATQGTCAISNECVICIEEEYHRRNHLCTCQYHGSMVNLALENQEGLCGRHALPMVVFTGSHQTLNGGTVTAENQILSSTTYPGIPVCLWELGSAFWTDTRSKYSTKEATLLGEGKEYGSHRTTAWKNGLYQWLIATSTEMQLDVESQEYFISIPSGSHLLQGNLIVKTTKTASNLHIPFVLGEEAPIATINWPDGSLKGVVHHDK